MPSLSIPPRPSEASRERAVKSAVSDIIFEDWGGTKKNEKLNGVSLRSQRKKTCVESGHKPYGDIDGKVLFKI